MITFKDLEKPVLISLYDMQGKLILQQSTNGRGLAVLNTIKLSNGMYLLEVTEGENKAVYKVEKN